MLGRENVKVSFRANKRIDAFFILGQDSSLKTLAELIKLFEKKLAQQNIFTDPGDFNLKIKEMWFSGKKFDFAIAGNKKIKVHINILGMQSEVFLVKKYFILAQQIPSLHTFSSSFDMLPLFTVARNLRKKWIFEGTSMLGFRQVEALC